MDLTQIVKENAQARNTILNMNIAEIAKRYGVRLSQAQQLQNLAALLEAAE